MKKNYSLKAFGIVAILALMSNQASAQTTTGNVVKGVGSIPTVKVVDNKGTIKYFQSNNGITQIVNTTGDKTTTTWQLGGVLTDNTYIEAGTGKVFALDGLALATGAASTDATTGSSHNSATPGTGYTLLVRDELTGAVQKMLATSLIDGGVYESVLTVDSGATPDDIAAITGITTVSNRISVFRNGIKLRQMGTPDWSLSAGKIVFTPAAGPFYAGDVIEVQWVK
jgi:hypothetical protein